jgi:thermostable 8-oxoguanine DNA glycosylase
MKQKLLLDYLISLLASDMNSLRLQTPTFSLESRPEEIWKQKVFCVLSSQVNSFRAASIVGSVVTNISFFDHSIPFPHIEEACFRLLSSPEIGYRFPSTRARQISLCWFLFWQIKDDYHGYVRSFQTEEKARSEIAKTFPGLGFKQTSMFLRNIGACKSLSVIDVHVLNYLKTCHNWKIHNLTQARYLEAEDILRKDADRYGVELNVFDTILWASMRALKRMSANV